MVEHRTRNQVVLGLIFVDGTEFCPGLIPME